MTEKATLAQRILDLLSRSPGLSDRDIADRLLGAAAPQQAVNAECHRLEGRGLVRRVKRPLESIRNYPTGASAADAPRSAPRTASSDGASLDEDAVKGHLAVWLKEQGWPQVQVAWGHTHGVDVQARRGQERWVIEVKGPGSRPEMRVNYFIGMLGEVLQRMDDPHARYSIALPSHPQFRSLWARLPAHAKERTGITALFVDASGQVEHLR